jgi:hypothetical protein
MGRRAAPGRAPVHPVEVGHRHIDHRQRPQGRRTQGPEEASQAGDLDRLPAQPRAHIERLDGTVQTQRLAQQHRRVNTAAHQHTGRAAAS